MNCPFCGAPMESGTLNHMDEAFWTSDQHNKNISWKSFLTWNGLKKLVSESTTIEIPAQGDWIMGAYEIPAYYCPNCHKFIFTGRVTDE